MLEELVLKQKKKYLERKAEERRAAIELEPSTLTYAMAKASDALAGKADPGSITFADLPLEARRAACQKSILAWAMNCRPHSIKPFLHTRLIDRYLVRCFSHDNPHNYLQISMPPRSGKTLLSTIFGATWYLGHNPDHSVFVVTYNSGTAGDFGREARLIFQQFAPDIFGVELDTTIRSDNKWRIKGHEGGFYSVGWGGPITGKKVHLLIIDDLIKNDEEATSPRFRDKIWSWWDGTAAQRVQNNPEVQTKVLSIQTRWTTQDLNGRLIDHERAGGSMRWDKLVLPALAENGDVVIDGELVMKEGESLCEELLPTKYLLDCKRNRSRFWWNALYQHRPLTQDGILWGPELFSDDLFVDEWPKSLEYLVVAVDPATGMALRDGDYSAIVALGMDRSGRLYASASMEKSGPVETNKRLADFCTRQLPRHPDMVAIEANGFQFLMTSMAAEALVVSGLDQKLIDYKTDERGVPINKVDRITELDGLITNRDITFVRGAGTAMLVSQLQNFPSRDHDDGPDALELASWVLANL